MEGFADGGKSRLQSPRNLRVHHLSQASEDDLDLVKTGLSAESPWLHPKFFYDARGSVLFDAITRTPEYYPTRVEADIFDRFLPQMLARVANRRVLVEPGSGSCEKAMSLLQDAQLQHYAPIEISRDYLVSCCGRLAASHPELTVDAICGDFVQCRSLPPEVPEAGRLVFFPGSTIGNFDPDQARDLLANFRDLAAEGGHLLIGTDLPKDRATLEAAYNDSEGLTARFNLNMLSHLNHRLDCELKPGAFRHEAFYNEAAGRIEMHLVCRRATELRAGDLRRRLAPGDSIHTESSYKYEPDTFLALAQSAGLAPVECWTDPKAWFAVHLLRSA
ncbi:MAG: L-histidine N(alpha)-methyltransferase [Marinobacter sp.]|uniref:L-histidine N(alpha)-methyltransferase n=1 Tax=Marinobacter sp. TaxID=50741 RepID=UPI00299D7E11|nr:L-histidine N(alpha)-methyltransferase [Marinobacter sp.]MDX1635862.1 L-histidine N(alpha)-methyltransferase [Marinobacter sp.]